MIKSIIFDCDPGNDDAIALLVAMASPETFLVKGITTVAGNVDVTQVTENALKITELAHQNIPVYSGCSRPLITHHGERDGAHGQTGMDGSNLPTPKTQAQPQHAVDFIEQSLKQSEDKITLCATGPLTNIAHVLIKSPELADHIEEIVLMGGSTDCGNITVASEFNMFSDPHAAHVVLNAGAKITMIGLNVTHKVIVTPARIMEFENLENIIGQQIANMMKDSIDFDVKKYGLKGRAIHDVCVPLYLINPELFDCKPAAINVEIWSKSNKGNTMVSFYPGHLPKQPHNVAVDADVDGCFALIYERLARYYTCPDLGVAWL